MDEWEREWIVWGMAWAGLRHWLYGRAAGEEAREWVLQGIDARRDGRCLTPLMHRLEGDLGRRLCRGERHEEKGAEEFEIPPPPFVPFLDPCR